MCFVFSLVIRDHSKIKAIREIANWMMHFLVVFFVYLFYTTAWSKDLSETLSGTCKIKHVLMQVLWIIVEKQSLYFWYPCVHVFCGVDACVCMPVCEHMCTGTCGDWRLMLGYLSWSFSTLLKQILSLESKAHRFC